MAGESNVNEDSLPIWEKMVLQERRQAAQKVGKRVSDLEEEASMLSAMQQSLENDKQNEHETERTSTIDNPRVSAAILVSSGDDRNRTVETGKVAANNCDPSLADDNDHDDLDQPHEFENISSSYDYNQTASHLNASTSTDESIQEKPSIWLKLPVELAQRILIILGDVDMLGYLNLVAKRNPFKPTEYVYRTLCHDIFPRQTIKKKLLVERWRSWRNMLIHRPRIRTNGFYCLRTSYTKAPNNDRFWEPRQTEFIEVKFYRHMRFYNDGYMLYSMDIVDPWDMAKNLEPGLPSYRKIYEGKYSMIGNNVTVEVVLHYCVMRFKMLLLDGDDGYQGKHNMLTIIEHSSVPLTPQQKLEQQAIELSQQPQLGRRPVPMPSNFPVTSQSSVNLEASRVIYPLTSPCSLRFFRHWNWVP